MEPFLNNEKIFCIIFCEYWNIYQITRSVCQYWQKYLSEYISYFTPYKKKQSSQLGI